MQQSGLWSIFILTLVPLARFVECQSTLPVPVPPSVVQCSQFGASASGFCIESTGYPTQINGINVDLYHYTDGWATPNPTGDLNIAAIGNALRTTLPLFSTFAPPFDVTIALIKSFNNTSNTNLAETTAVLPDGTPCYILIREQPNNGTDPSFYLEHTTTDELYHCVELRNQGNHPLGSSWWTEGSAEYFASKFYQESGSQSPIKSYDPNARLYDQAEPESTSIFFQFLSNQGWDDNTINGFIQQIKDAQLGGTERAIMSSNADLQRLFPIFAQKFSGLAITFPDGSSAQGNPGKTINETEIVLNNLQSDGQQIFAPVVVPSFAMSMYTATLQPGATYSIQWAPSAQDGKTVLAYQKDLSGNTAWTTVDPATPIQIPIGCSSAPVQHKFLLTSTANVDLSNGRITVVRQSSQSCGCNDVGIPLDPCLSGNWTLNPNEFQIYLTGRLTALQGLTISNLVVAGASYLEGGGAMAFDPLSIDYNATRSGESLHTTIDLTGSVTGRMVMQAAGQFCWANGQGEGQANTSITMAGLGGPYELDVPLATAYAGPTITVNYTCSATSLQLVGSDNGQYAWALSYLRA